jgi:predicted MFS family arabinose efflux permease
MRHYLSLLARSHVRWMLAGAFLGRVPYSTESIGTVVFVKSTIGSYAVAGAVAGALAAGIAAGSVFQGRLADRAGRIALVPLGALHVLLMAMLVVGGTHGWAWGSLVVVALAAGLAVPPTSAVFRGLYPEVLADIGSDVRAAFALDSALSDVTYIAGPALVSIGVLLASPSAALIFAAGTALASVLVLVLRTPATTPTLAIPKPAGALRAPAIRTLALATVPLGAAFGVCEVAFPAFGSSQGDVALGGLLLALAGLASCVSALLFGANPDRDPAAAFLRYSFWLPPMFVVPAAGGSAAAVALLTIPMGAVAGPWTVSRNQLTGHFSLRGTAAEAYAWHVTALLVGTAIGTALGGPLVEHAGWREALAVAAVIAASVGVLTFRQRARLRVIPHMD